MKRLFLLLFLLCGCLSALFAQPFAQEIRRFQYQDSVQKPLPGSVLFIGSSSFTNWKDVADYFPDSRIVNRGFGGSSLTHLLLYADQVIFPYNPAQVVIYCGENDLASAKSVPADTILSRFSQLHRLIRSRYPTVPILFVSLKPSPSRVDFLPAMVESNRLISRFCRKMPHTRFLDIYSKMLDKAGKPREDLFLSDRLHMNRNGYLIWQECLKNKLVRHTNS